MELCTAEYDRLLFPVCRQFVARVVIFQHPIVDTNSWCSSVFVRHHTNRDDHGLLDGDKSAFNISETKESMTSRGFGEVLRGGQLNGLHAPMSIVCAGIVTNRNSEILCRRNCSIAQPTASVGASYANYALLRPMVTVSVSSITLAKNDAKPNQIPSRVWRH